MIARQGEGARSAVEVDLITGPEISEIVVNTQIVRSGKINERLEIGRSSSAGPVSVRAHLVVSAVAIPSEGALREDMRARDASDKNGARAEYKPGT